MPSFLFRDTKGIHQGIRQQDFAPLPKACGPGRRKASTGFHRCCGFVFENILGWLDWGLSDAMSQVHSWIKVSQCSPKVERSFSTIFWDYVVSGTEIQRLSWPLAAWDYLNTIARSEPRIFKCFSFFFRSGVVFNHRLFFSQPFQFNIMMLCMVPRQLSSKSRSSSLMCGWFALFDQQIGYINSIKINCTDQNFPKSAWTEKTSFWGDPC